MYLELFIHSLHYEELNIKFIKLKALLSGNFEYLNIAALDVLAFISKKMYTVGESAT